MDVGAVDWFTKEREEKVNLEEVKAELIKEIVEKSKNTNRDKKNNFKKFADITWKVLKENEDLKKICADSRLPICSLFHHLKNTSAVAVCMAIDRGCDKETVRKIRVASLLHDIGKLESWQKYGEMGFGIEHVKATEKIVGEILSKCGLEWMDKTDICHYIPRLASRHHRGKWAEGYLPEGSEKIIADADSIASATDRVYDVICEGVEKGKCEVTIKSKDRIFPHKIIFEKCDFNPENKEDENIAIGRLEERRVKLSLSKGFDNRKHSAKVFYDEIVKGYSIKYLGHPGQLNGEIGLLLLDIQGIQNFISEAKKLHALRGGSYIVEKAQEIAESIISKKVCPEAVLFKGGGNLLAFVPSIINKDKLRNDIESEIERLSKKGLKCKIFIKNYAMDRVAGNFDEILKDIFDKVNEEKNKPYTSGAVIRAKEHKDICDYCFKRIIRGNQDDENCCEVCSEKIGVGRVQKDIMRKYTKKVINDKELKCKRSNELGHIGNNIAVIAMDGNMMGRCFQQTMTPAEYNYKSETFDKELKKIFKEFIYDFCSNNKKNVINNGYLSIDPLYIGGDDILLITNTKIALKFAEEFIKEISQKFTFKPKAIEGYETPIVTFSIGIAMANHKFPIYFLIRKAHELQKKASRAFRKNVSVNDLKLHNLPKGAISFSAVTSAMPSEESHTFVFPDDKEKFEKLLDGMRYATERQENKKSFVSLIINTEDDKESKLNAIKYLYARMGAKEKITIEDCEYASELIKDNDILNALKSAVPMVWHSKKENE